MRIDTYARSRDEAVEEKAKHNNLLVRSGSGSNPDLQLGKNGLKAMLSW